MQYIPMMSLPNPSHPLDLIGYVFEPTSTDIFTHFLPARLILGKNALQKTHKNLITEFDLYGKKSPDELFKSSNDTEFYFFTPLSKLKGSNNRIRREIAEKGTWMCRSKPQDYVVEIEKGKEIEAGSKRLFKFKYLKEDDTRDEWIMHEYVVEKDYINSLRKLDKFKGNNSNHNNYYIQDLAFCYVYKKMEKNMKTIKKRKATYCLTEESNTNSFNEHHMITVDVPAHEPDNDEHVPQHNGADDDDDDDDIFGSLTDIVDLSTFGL